MRVIDFKLDSRRVEIHEIPIDLQESEPWWLAEKRVPLDLEKTTFRIMSIFLRAQPVVKVFGKRAEEITQVVLRSEPTEVEWGPEMVEDFIPIHLSWKLCGVKDEVYIPDAVINFKAGNLDENDSEGGSIEEGEEPGRLKLINLPAGTKLVCTKTIAWDDLHSNNFYVECDATIYSANGDQRIIVLTQDTQINCDTFWPVENGVLEATSFEQLDTLHSCSLPYKPEGPVPEIGPYSEDMDLKFLESHVRSYFDFRVYLFMMSHLKEEQRPQNPMINKMTEHIEACKEFIASRQ